MITTEIERTVNVNSPDQREFTIKANSKAFKVLIDGIYSNKIESIIREIWSNALDSHVMAGKTKVPFVVHLPTIFDQTFSVQDFGIGLSKEDVFNIYTTLFESTKEGTDEQVGKFGIGSKTPFAYTDTFSITSVYNHIKTYYTASLNSKSVPQISVMGETVTDECNGVKVSLSVNARDIKSFVSSAKRVGLGFDLKPTISNIDDFNWYSLGEEIYPGVWTTSQFQGVYAKMGCVLYPINVDVIREECDKIEGDFKKLLSFLEDIEEAGKYSMVTIAFDVGKLEVSASRENLSYGLEEPTISSFIERADEFIGIVEAEISKLVDEETYIQACLSFTKLLNKLILFSKTTSHVQMTHKDGLVITNSIQINSFSKNMSHRFYDFTYKNNLYYQSSSKYSLITKTNIHFDIFSKAKSPEKKDICLLMIQGDANDRETRKVHRSSLSKRIEILRETYSHVYAFEIKDNYDIPFIHGIMDIFKGVDVKFATDLPLLEKKSVVKKTEEFILKHFEHDEITSKYITAEDIANKNYVSIVLGPHQSVNKYFRSGDYTNKLKILMNKSFCSWYDGIVVFSYSQRKVAKKIGLAAADIDGDYQKLNGFLNSDILDGYEDWKTNKTESLPVLRVNFYNMLISKTKNEEMRKKLCQFTKRDVIINQNLTSLYSTLFYLEKLHTSFQQTPSQIDVDFLDENPEIKLVLSILEDCGSYYANNIMSSAVNKLRPYLKGI